MSETTTKKPKQTAQEKAQQAVDVAQRKVKKLEARRDDLAAKGQAVLDDLVAAQRQLDFLKQHPALTQETTPAVQEREGAEADPKVGTPGAERLGDF